MLMPEAWVIDDDQRQLPGLEVMRPFAEVVDSVKTIQNWVIFGMASIGLVIGFPSIILFYYYLRQSLVDDKKTILLLIGYGAPQSMIQQWYGGKLTWLMIELILPTFIVIIGFDFVIKNFLSSGFFIEIPYRFPIESISVLLGLFIVFYTSMIGLQNNTIDRLSKKK
jgi:hypothetical protein